MKKVVALLLAALLCLTMFAGCGEEEPITVSEFPEGDTLTVLCPQAAGTEQDTICRIVAAHIGKYLNNKTVIVENMGGAATTVAGSNLYAQDANVGTIIQLDNYQQVVSPVINNSVYDYKAFNPVFKFTVNENLIWVKGDSPINTWEEFVTWAKQKGEITMATGPVGGQPYAALATTMGIAGIKAEALVGKNVPAGIVNVMGGFADVCFASAAMGRDYYKNGDIKPILALSESNFMGYDGYPLNVPNSREKLDFAMQSIHTFCMKSNSEQVYQDYMAEALAKMYKDADFQADMTKAGYLILDDCSREAAQKAKDDMIELMPKMLRILGVNQ